MLQVSFVTNEPVYCLGCPIMTAAKRLTVDGRISSGFPETITFSLVFIFSFFALLWFKKLQTLPVDLSFLSYFVRVFSLYSFCHRLVKKKK